MLARWSAGHEKSAIYHVVSRVVNRDFIFGAQEKEHFVKLMRLYERFCGVKVLTYCMMSNHFHILLEIPPKSQRPDFSDDEAFLKHCAILYSNKQLAETRWQLEHFRKSENSAGIDMLKQDVLYRMHDLSQFMKTLKQRFTQWFNRQHNRRGTIWEERFKSMIVQGGQACRTVAAYIDLNPVRANIAKDPKDYRWCGYAEAVAGNKQAIIGLREILLDHHIKNSNSRAILENYRQHLFIDGEQSSAKSRPGFTRQHVEQVLATGGKLTHSQMLRCRVRYFVDGGIIGSKAFVDEQFQLMRDRFGEKRQSGARRARSIIPEFFVLRDLQKERFA